jgi:nitroimidazol reductase NimA-like FMN-containing flavoprotein (pyridoxamine 5'-phosphate oxidase superfamily)
MTKGATDRSGLEVLDMEECLELLASVPIGRVAMVDGGEIAVLPVNHVVDDGRVCFRTAPGAKLDAGIMQHVVTFEADDFDDDARTGWSVIVKGRADLVTDPDELERLRDSGIRPWANPTFRTNWVTLHATSITGRRIDVDDASDG